MINNTHQQVFNAAYASLNTAQRQAVDMIDGPVMVIAGPGTGKTQILTLRIANILLQTDTAPESILALTFTESGAKAMRERLHRYIGARAYQVRIFTFHGFAGMLIGEYPDAYERIIGGRPANDLEIIEIIESLLDDQSIKLLRPTGNPAYYVKPIRSILSELKKEYIRPNDFVKIIEDQKLILENTEKIHEKGAHKGKVRGEYSKLEKIIAKNLELLFVYRRYEAVMSEQKLYDFEDMIGETVRALSTDESMLRDLQEQYQYILADEHQDVNGSQNHILELLASYHNQPNIFVVGDEKQAIYRFQGASLSNFLFFQERFIGTKVISLTDNYRSGQKILDAAHSLVAVEDTNLSKLRIPLVAKVVNKSRVEQRTFSHQALEDSWVVAQIEQRITDGVLPEEIAVIVRTNKEVEGIADQLRKKGIVAEASADGDILNHPITQGVESLINAVITDDNELALFSVLHGAYWGLTADDIIKIVSARKYNTTLLSILNDESKLTELGVSSTTKAKRVSDVITEARSRESYEPPHRVAEYLLQASGFLQHVITNDPLEGVRIIRRLYDDIENLVTSQGAGTLRSVHSMLMKRRKFGLPLIAPFINTNSKAVQVITAHKSKGQEFDVVFVPHLQDSIWGGTAKRSSFDIPLAKSVSEDLFDAFDDERRLLYVAMTRAKTELNFSSSEISLEGKALIPTRLFDFIDLQTITNVPTSLEEGTFSPADTLLQPLLPRKITKDLVLNLFTTRGFSATSLNNYLHNPWDYIYRNILRIPETKSVQMQFGTVVHNVLEYVTRYHTEKQELPSVTQIKTLLEQELERLPLSKNDFARLHEKGLNVLLPYIEHLVKFLPEKTKEEMSLHVMLPTGIPELPEISLSGKLDRIDLNKNGQATLIVDYKTGKPKTRNEIEGKTATGTGDYKRQLVFYALLLSLYGDDRYQCREGLLSFVEPDSKNKIREERFIITDEEISSLRQEIIKAVTDIVAGNWLIDKSRRQESKYADLINLL